MANEVVTEFKRAPTDAETANEYKERASKILGELMETMRESERKGFIIEFQINRDQLGRPWFAAPTVIKRY